jgi:hypothetical protein
MTAGGTRQEMTVDDFAVRTSKQRPGRLECTDEEYKKSTPNCFSPASAKLKLEGKFSIARGIDNRVIGQSLRQNIAVLEGKILHCTTILLSFKPLTSFNFAIPF